MPTSQCVLGASLRSVSITPTMAADGELSTVHGTATSRTWGPCMEALSGGGLSPLASTFLQSGGEHTHTTEWGEVMARMQAGRLLPEHESGGTRRLAGTQACCARSKTRGSNESSRKTV